MATWSRSTKTKVVHEWHIPNGCWNQLQQALTDAVRTRAISLGLPGMEIADTALMFKATDDGVILYYEVETRDHRRSDDEPPF